MREKEDLQEILEKEFKWFHENPELSFEEYETTKNNKYKDDLKYILDNPEYTKEQLDDFGMSVYWDFEEFIYEFISEYERM